MFLRHLFGVFTNLYCMKLTKVEESQFRQKTNFRWNCTFQSIVGWKYKYTNKSVLDTLNVANLAFLLSTQIGTNSQRTRAVKSNNDEISVGIGPVNLLLAT